MWKRLRRGSLNYWVQTAESSIEQASYSMLTWRVDVYNNIRSAVNDFPDQKMLSVKLLSEERVGPTCEIKGISTRVFSSVTSRGSMQSETPGSLVYSLGADGTVAVILYPPRYDDKKLKGDHYVIDVFSSAHCLAGAAGQDRVRGHLVLFVRLCLMSMPDIRPTQSTEKLINYLDSRAKRFRSVYKGEGDAEIIRISQQWNLAVGLIVGLTASTILPLARDAGKEGLENAKTILMLCAPLSGSRLVDCFGQRHYLFWSFLGRTLTTQNVLIGGILMLAVAIVILRKLSLRR